MDGKSHKYIFKSLRFLTKKMFNSHKIDKKLYSFKYRFSFVLIIFLIYSFFISDIDKLYYDSSDYWYAAALFFKNKELFSFSILNFKNSLRGFMFPLILLPFFIIRFITNLDPIIMVKIFGSLSSSFLLAYALPNLYELISQSKIKWTLLKFIIFISLSMLFWRGYFIYTLTDVPAFLLLTTAIVLNFGNNKYQFIISGLFIASAINFRPVYLSISPLFLILTLLINNKNKFAKFVFIMFGASLVFIPQSLINHINFNSYSPFVLAKSSNNLKNKASLYVWHLQWGMKFQKFETSVNLAHTETPCLVIADPQGTALINKVNAGVAFSSISEYMRGVYAYPLDYFLLYLRRVFNILDLKYSEPYIKDSNYSLSIISSILNYLVIFFGLLSFVLSISKKNFVASMLAMLMMITLIVVTLPIVVEIRFGLPFHFLLITYLCFSDKINIEYINTKFKLFYLSIFLSLWLGLCIYYTIYFHNLSYYKEIFVF